MPPYSHDMHNRSMVRLLWLIPLLAQSQDALAWGLYTHVYFAQLLVWSVPLLDPAFLRAVRRFPHLVMAGACLPDLSLVGKHAGTQAFQQNHQWQRGIKLAQDADNDTERALALGYVSHLFVDIIAHNHFVPAHESLWLETRMMTHIASEWAMDAHLQRQVFASPHSLLRGHAGPISDFLNKHYGCSRQEAARAIHILARADALLRFSGISPTLYRWASWLDKHTQGRFDYYVGETVERLPQINRVLQGDWPAWGAEPPRDEVSQRGEAEFLCPFNGNFSPLPQDLFIAPSEQ
jgi:hypothetical protein